jgi:hypothetical protein
MATQPALSKWDGPVTKPAGAPATARAAGGAAADTAGFGAIAQQFGVTAPDPATRPRVVMQFPADTASMLLSGTLAGGRVLANKAQIVDAPLGEGHVVMFAIRPFWRWQTQGTYMLGFNTILNWNDLDAGKAGVNATATRANGSQ